MPSLQGQVGELRFKVYVTRKDTGKVEEYDMVGMASEEQLKQLMEAPDGSNSLDSGAQCSD